MGCAREKVCTVVFAVTVSMVFFCLVSTGCKKRVKPPAEVPVVQESVYTNRANNAAYIESLQQNRRKQVAKGLELTSAIAEMNAYKARVKATLATGADEAALELALAKDEAWLKLKTRGEKAQIEIQQTLEEARERVRQGMVEESRAIKAVSDGKAKALDQEKTK